MSVSGDPQTRNDGASPVPAGDVNRQSGAAVPSGNADAAMSSAEVGEGPGSPDLSVLSELDLQDPAIVEAIRKASNGYFYTRDDVQKSQATLAQRAQRAQQQAQQAQEMRDALQQRSEFLEKHLRENFDEEEVENLLARFERDSSQRQQAVMQERQQLAQDWVQTEQKSFTDFLMESAYDGERQLFDPQDAEIQQAFRNYLGAVQAAAFAQDDNSLDVFNQWKRHARSLVLRKMRDGLRGGNQSQAAPEPNQAPQQPQNQQQQRPSRGRQVTAPGGAGGGQASFGELYKQNIDSGMDPQQAFTEAQVAAMTGGPA